MVIDEATSDYFSLVVISENDDNNDEVQEWLTGSDDYVGDITITDQSGGDVTFEHSSMEYTTNYMFRLKDVVSINVVYSVANLDSANVGLPKNIDENRAYKCDTRLFNLTDCREGIKNFCSDGDNSNHRLCTSSAFMGFMTTTLLLAILS